LIGSTLFYFFAAVTVASALLVVLNRNAVYSAVLLVLCLFSLAVIFLLMEAYFLAILEILIYAGAIMVLFLFVIMLLNMKREDAMPKFMQLQRGFSFLLVLFFFLSFSLFMLQGSVSLHQPVGSVSTGSVTALGEALFTKYLLPFEVASLLLFVALIGTVYLAKRRLQ